MTESAASFPHYKRNVTLLSSCWALVSTGMMVVVSVTALVGNMLAENKELSTLPVALQFVATALATVPASFLMRAIGRRNGFIVAALLMIVGGLGGVGAIYLRDFWLYCGSCALVGAATSFGWYYRFAAAEVVPESFKSRAISLVLAGGIMAAIVGPTLARFSRDMLEPVLFAGSYVTVIVVQLAVILVLMFIRIPKPPDVELRGGRPILEIARQPKFIVAVVGGVVAYGVMVMLMSVTPLAMEICGLDFADATQVIQWHVLGMYVPAFFTGHLIKRFGAERIMLAGGVANIACLIIAASGITFTHFWVAMALVGVGWNFLYTGATTLLTETYTTAERAKTQALNEFLIFSFVATGTFVSGLVVTSLSWQALALGVLPLLLIVLAALGWHSLRARGPETA